MAEQRDLLKIFTELSTDLDAAVKRDKVNGVLHNQPREAWIRKHPKIEVKVDGKWQPLQYIPVGIVRTLMKAFFQRVKREIISCKVEANSMLTIVRVHYIDPLSGEWDFQDGVGAMPLQLDAGATASDASKIKSNAVQIAAPASASFAYKNACEEIGAIFGSDLQKHGIEFTGLYETAAASHAAAPALRSESIETKQIDEITTSF